jgi:hypothetical protein
MTNGCGQRGSFRGPVVGGSRHNRRLAVTVLVAGVLFVVLSVAKPWANNGPPVVSMATAPPETSPSAAAQATLATPSSGPSARPLLPSPWLQTFDLGARLHAIAGNVVCRPAGGGAGGGSGGSFDWDQSTRCRLAPAARAAFTAKVVGTVSAFFPSGHRSESSGTNEPTVWQTSYILGPVAGSVVLMVIDIGPDLLIVAAGSEQDARP